MLVGARRRGDPTGGRCALLLAASVVVGSTMPSKVASAEASNCKMVQIADLPVRLAHNRLIVDGAINGQKIGIMLDTGSTITVIPRPAATRLGLSRQKASGYRMFGIGGETDAESTVVDEFKIGQSTVKGRRMMVAGEHEIGDDVTVILGEDFFHQTDVEFDLAHSTVRLFQPKDCSGASLAYWAANDASEIAIEAIDDAHPKILLTVQINGKPVRAQFDSGAPTSVLDRSEAVRLGVTIGAAVGSGTGLGPESVDWTVAPLQHFAIGDEAVSDTTIELTDITKGLSYIEPGSLLRRKIEGTAAMLLGVDFLRAHRVLVAHSQRKIYFTYLGGPVFQRVEPAKGKSDPDRTIADYDAAIRTNPQNAEAFLARGKAWSEKKDYDRAIADYDAAIRINPQFASALGSRGVARMAKGDFEQGIADLTRAIEINPRLAPAFVIRGDAKRHTGDVEGAIADYSHAIEIDPKLATAYNQLAWELATAERQAIRDGPRAVEMALKACELSGWKNPTYIDTLAAAYARAGHFEEAVKWQHKAMETSQRANDDKAAQRLRLYEKGTPWPPD